MTEKLTKEAQYFLDHPPEGYTFLKFIGSGGFSLVFLVHSQVHQCDFVCKVITKIPPFQRLNTDYEFLPDLDSPYVIRIYDTFQINKATYLVLESCPQTVKSFLKAANSNTQLLKTFYQILIGVHFCHTHQIAHRDIKPENILVDEYGRPKLIDFGISLKVDPGELIEESSGSRSYQAPESIHGERHDPFQADVWSLGVTFYVLGVGVLPWDVKNEKQRLKLIEQATYSFPNEVFPPVAILAQSMIVVDPHRRVSLEKLMNLEFFNDVKNKVESQIQPKLKLTRTRNLPCFDTNSLKSKRGCAINQHVMKSSFLSPVRK